MADGSLVLKSHENHQSHIEDYFDSVFQIKGKRTGWPDRMLFTEHGPVGIEVKMNGDTMKHQQVEIAEDFVERTWPYVVVRFFEKATKTKGPGIIFTFQRYIGNGCYQGMTLEDFCTLIDLAHSKQRIARLDEYGNTRYKGFVLNAQVGPAYHTTTLSLEDRQKMTNDMPLIEETEKNE